MCTVLFSIKSNSDYEFILAANRDEFFRRPTAPLHFWGAEKSILAGRDLEGGGSWLGVNTKGRFAVLTNFREPMAEKKSFLSRGELVENVLSYSGPVSNFYSVVGDADKYRGFNLLYGNSKEMYYFSNRKKDVILLPPGIYGLSNHFLDSPWPKVEKGKYRFFQIVDQNQFTNLQLFAMLEDTARPEDSMLPDTGIGLQWERLLSSIHIRGEIYGTRSAAIITQDSAGQICFTERTYSEDGRERTDRMETITLEL